ncbi:MAG: hypothetical protein D6756_10890 [Cyanobacteria bacterium J083]|nr:MAG: hypothetical protein D6756_10890 [Cyanobacteria bacterium J083]
MIQDDARQHVFWMLRFLDSNLFPQDIIADYFQSVAPWGYKNFYRCFAWLGINPIFFSKILPTYLGLITTIYTFYLTLEIIPVAAVGFVSTLLLNQYLWLRDDLVSATPVAFVYPLLTAAIYYLLKGNLIGCLLATAGLGLFYPQAALIMGGVFILGLIFKKRASKLTTYPRNLINLVGLGVVTLVAVLYGSQTSDYAPIISASEAKTMAEFLNKGKSEFFVPYWGEFWFTGQRTGLMPRFKTILPLIASLFLPLLYLAPLQFPLLRKIQNKGRILIDITAASLGMFALSHVLLFKLHLPSRYTEHTLRIVTAIAGGIAIVAVIDGLLAKVTGRGIGSHLAFLLASSLFSLVLINPALMSQFPDTDYIVGNYPNLYKFFQQQPVDTLIASVTEETNNLPAFTKRSILVGNEGYSVPYHQGYYREIKQRSVDLIQAQYSADLKVVQQFIAKYGVDFWLLQREIFQPVYLANNRWFMQYQPYTNQAIAQLQAKQEPALRKIQKTCTVWQEEPFWVLDAECISNLDSSTFPH